MACMSGRHCLHVESGDPSTVTEVPSYLPGAALPEKLHASSSSRDTRVARTAPPLPEARLELKEQRCRGREVGGGGQG